MSGGLRVTARVEERGVDLTFEVASGETLALLGANGAGKSTVLAVIAGLLRPESSRVELEGRVLSGEQWVPAHDRQVAMLAQDALLFPHLSALDNVAFGPRSRGRSRSEARRVAARWLDEVGVGELAERRPGQLSGGQAQRVALARALAAEPQLLLLDEPMAALDVAVAPALRHTLRRVLAGRTAVIVTHDVLDAALLADRVLVLAEGRVVESGPAAGVLARPRSAFAARIAGLNLLPGTWDGRGVRIRDGVVVQGLVDGAAPGLEETVVAVFRPSAVSVFAEHPHGSPRNALVVDVSEIEPLGDRVRVRAGGLSADITLTAATELALAPGQRVWFSVKATEVAVYAAPSGPGPVPFP